MKLQILATITLLSFSSAFANSPSIVYKEDLNLKKSANTYPMIQKMCDNIKSAPSDNGELNFSYSASEVSYLLATGKSSASGLAIKEKLNKIYNRTNKTKTKGYLPVTFMEITRDLTADVVIDCDIMKVVTHLYFSPSSDTQFGLINDSAFVFGGEHVSKIQLEENNLNMRFHLPIFQYISKGLNLEDAQAVSLRSMKLKTKFQPGSFKVSDLRDLNVDTYVKEIVNGSNLKNKTQGYALVADSFGGNVDFMFIPAKNRAELEQFVTELKKINTEAVAKIYVTTAQDMVAFSVAKDLSMSLAPFEPLAETIREEAKSRASERTSKIK